MYICCRGANKRIYESKQEREGWKASERARESKGERGREKERVRERGRERERERERKQQRESESEREREAHTIDDSGTTLLHCADEVAMQPCCVVDSLHIWLVCIHTYICMHYCQYLALH